ncbi:MAG TPA: hypothetical protein VJ645_07130 [Gaiellaceae bacterium]|nr:hypothetical protein [Gaiellaceae bacterium]
MKHRIHTFVAALMLLPFAAAAAGTASAHQSVAKPGFPSGTWIGTGVLTGKTETVGDITTRTSGTAKFTLTVKGGKVSGRGTWRTTQVGSGSVGSKIVGVASVTFSGTPIDVRFKGTEVIKTSFVDAAHTTGNVFTREAPYSGRLVIKKALSCRVTGGHAFEDGTFTWKAALKGVTCR